jgi:hypothetical protein
MILSPVLQEVRAPFERHERRYCIFSLCGCGEDFLYYSHVSRPLRSLMRGDDFTGQLPQLMQKEYLCIECGLGLSVNGGVALDSGDLIAWNCTVEEANAVLASLSEYLGTEGRWIELF